MELDKNAWQYVAVPSYRLGHILEEFARINPHLHNAINDYVMRRGEKPGPAVRNTPFENSSLYQLADEFIQLSEGLLRKYRPESKHDPEFRECFCGKMKATSIRLAKIKALSGSKGRKRKLALPSTSTFEVTSLPGYIDGVSVSDQGFKRFVIIGVKTVRLRYIFFIENPNNQFLLY